jgi:hypothetical protein
VPAVGQSAQCCWRSAQCCAAPRNHSVVVYSRTNRTAVPSSKACIVALQQWSVTRGGDSFACMPSLACKGRVTLLACFAQYHVRCALPCPVLCCSCTAEVGGVAERMVGGWRCLLALHASCCLTLPALCPAAVSCAAAALLRLAALRAGVGWRCLLASHASCCLTLPALCPAAVCCPAAALLRLAALRSAWWGGWRTCSTARPPARHPALQQPLTRQHRTEDEA